MIYLFIYAPLQMELSLGLGSGFDMYDKQRKDEKRGNRWFIVGEVQIGRNVPLIQTTNSIRFVEKCCLLSTCFVAQACMASKTSWQIRGDHHDLRQVKTFSTELEKRLAVSPTFSQTGYFLQPTVSFGGANNSNPSTYFLKKKY